LFRAPSYKLNSRTFSVLKTTLISIDSSIDLRIDLVNEDPIIDMVEYLASIIRIGAQSITVGLLKLIIRLGIYNKD